MKKKRSIKITPSGKLNRSVTYLAYPDNVPIPFAVNFNSKNSVIQVQYNSRTSCIENNEVEVNIIRNLKNCRFCETFLNLETYKDKNSDVICKFSNVRPKFKNDIFNFLNEKIDLNTLNRKQNNLLITGWRFHAYENEYIYYFIQRSIYNRITNTNIIRTCGFEFLSKSGGKLINSYYTQYKKEIEKINPNDLPSFLDSIV